MKRIRQFLIPETDKYQPAWMNGVMMVLLVWLCVLGLFSFLAVGQIALVGNNRLFEDLLVVIKWSSLIGAVLLILAFIIDVSKLFVDKD